jgi:hypothetical protein
MDPAPRRLGAWLFAILANNTLAFENVLRIASLCGQLFLPRSVRDHDGSEGLGEPKCLHGARYGVPLMAHKIQLSLPGFQTPIILNQAIEQHHLLVIC